MRGDITRPEIVLGLALIQGHDVRPALSEIGLMRYALEVYAARETTRDLVPDHPRSRMRKLIANALADGTRSELAWVFRLCVTGIRPVYDYHRPAPAGEPSAIVRRLCALARARSDSEDPELSAAVDELAAREPGSRDPWSHPRRTVESALHAYDRLPCEARALDDRTLSVYARGALAAVRANREGRP